MIIQENKNPHIKQGNSLKWIIGDFVKHGTKSIEMIHKFMFYNKNILNEIVFLNFEDFETRTLDTSSKY